ncbi:MAG: hypothetical protein Q7J43_21605 [Pseudomonas sp.]|uniref:AbiU2 domain-containing protein n=1 Tax=Pseudomonas sp. TaxID=306 RepID=UPI00271869D3|nr:hypothetical protein [Pseudomonas sp.]MDO9620270.1 hypothetical protein [Pseudomonas sp.]MDP2447863.1 hypothetical protein [Pseudomonas sp.]MDZ4313411.1 hypothetical protein [Azonexus sp.]
MLDIDRFIFELDRLITAVHFYDEVYCNEDGVNAISSLSLEAAKIIQRSIHNDIVLSTARLVFDGKDFNSSEGARENLSQYNLACNYKEHIDPELEKHRTTIAALKNKVDIKSYRDLVIAHNDKPTITGQMPTPKHKIDTKTLLNLLDESRSLMFGIRLKVAKNNEETYLPVTDGKVKRCGVGREFVRRIKKI